MFDLCLLMCDDLVKYSKMRTIHRNNIKMQRFNLFSKSATLLLPYLLESIHLTYTFLLYRYKINNYYL